jgi:hypothetical protein
MTDREILLIMEHAYAYLADLEACLSAGQFAHLPHLQEEYEAAIARLQALTPVQAAPFLEDIVHLEARLHLLRDVMVAHHGAIGTQLEGMGNTSKAAKAYVKSGLVSEKETE